jgi:hypothetical protein
MFPTPTNLHFMCPSIYYIGQTDIFWRKNENKKQIPERRSALRKPVII